MNDAVQVQPIRMVDVFKTARFAVVSPTGRKRAALSAAMRHAHICFGKLLQTYMPDEAEVARLRSLSRRERRPEFSELQSRLERATTPWQQLGLAAKASIAREAVAAIASHIELKDVQEHAGVPSVPELKEVSPEHDAALLSLKNAIDLETESALRDELLRRARSGRCRPLYFAKVNKSDGFLLLRNEETGRIFVWLNLFPAKSRFAKPERVLWLSRAQ